MSLIEIFIVFNSWAVFSSYFYLSGFESTSNIPLGFLHKVKYSLLWWTMPMTMTAFHEAYKILEKARQEGKDDE